MKRQIKDTVSWFNGKKDHRKESDAQISGIFDNPTSARLAVKTIPRVTDLSLEQVNVVGPSDSSPLPNHPTQLKRKRIRSRVAKAHLFGLSIGALLGLIIAFTVSWYAPAPTDQNFGLLAAAGAILGATLGFLVALRLEFRVGNARFSKIIKKELNNGKWIVIAHTRNASEKAQTKDYLTSRANAVYST